MEVTFTVESTNGKIWKATCSDPSLEVEGPDIITVSKSMAGMIETWFTRTFNTNKKVVVSVPAIKAKIKATVAVRQETPLDEFGEDNSERLELAEPRGEIACKCTGCGADIVVKEDAPMLCESCSYEQKTQPKKPELPRPPGRVINGPCKYLSDGKGPYAVGMCEAVSDDPTDTPGLLTDIEGVCKAEYEKCAYYHGAGVRTSIAMPPDVSEANVEDEWPDEDDEMEDVDDMINEAE